MLLLVKKGIIMINNKRSDFEKFTKKDGKVYDNSGKEVILGDNRPLRLEGVKKYRLEMNDNLWRNDDWGQVPVMFDIVGICRSGQHRVTAFLESELIEIRFLVLRNASEEEIANQDNGINRTYRDIAITSRKMPELNNIQLAKTIAACRLLGEIFDGRKYDGTQIHNVANKYMVALEAADSLISKNGRMQRYSPVLSAFLWAKARLSKKDWVNNFTQFDLGTNILPDSPMHRLRTLTDKSASSRRQSDLFLKTLCALKAIHQGKTISPYLTASEKHMEGW